jgi:dTDP-4-dehydrorhamnose reductase
MATLN